MYTGMLQPQKVWFIWVNQIHLNYQSVACIHIPSFNISVIFQKMLPLHQRQLQPVKPAFCLDPSSLL